jgi:hypothetical protein
MVYTPEPRMARRCWASRGSLVGLTLECCVVCKVNEDGEGNERLGILGWKT